MPENASNKRLINFDLLKVFAIYSVIATHFWMYCVDHSPITGEMITIVNFLYGQLYTVLFHSGVMLFVLITGYFLSDTERKVNWTKFLSIWFYTLLYSIVFYFLFRSSPLSAGLDLRKTIHLILPFTGAQYWFVVDYLALIFFAPFLARLIKSLSYSQNIILLVLMTVFGLTIWFGIPFGNQVGMGNGYTLSFFVYLFFVGGSIRK